MSVIANRVAYLASVRNEKQSAQCFHMVELFSSGGVLSGVCAGAGLRDSTSDATAEMHENVLSQDGFTRAILMDTQVHTGGGGGANPAGSPRAVPGCS
eukprot:8530531-Prorocentrum_lima.AAC.1